MLKFNGKIQTELRKGELYFKGTDIYVSAALDEEILDDLLNGDFEIQAKNEDSINVKIGGVIYTYPLPMFDEMNLQDRLDAGEEIYGVFGCNNGLNKHIGKLENIDKNNTYKYKSNVIWADYFIEITDENIINLLK